MHHELSAPYSPAQNGIADRIKKNEVCMYNDGPRWTVRQMMKPFHLLFVLHLFVLAFAVQNGMMVHQMDVVTAFLNGTLDKEIYIKQPPGYIKKGEEHLL